MQRKTIMIIRFFSWALPSLAILAIGCGERPPSRAIAAKRPFEGVILRVACPNVPSQEIITTFSRSWAAREGAQVQTMSFVDDNETGKNVNADIIVTEPARMPSWAARGLLQPVPQAILRSQLQNWSDYLPIYRDKLLVWDGTTFAFPVLGESPLCYYRQDLFSNPEHRQAYRKEFNRDLAPPATWQEFRTICDYFSKNWQKGQTVPVLPPLPNTNDDLEWEFYSVAAPFVRKAYDGELKNVESPVEVFSFHYDLRTGKPRIDAPGFVHALRFLQDLALFRRTANALEPAEVFQTGSAIFCLANASWIPRFQKDTGFKNRFGICGIPGTAFTIDDSGSIINAPHGNCVPYLGAHGYVAAVLKNSQQVDAGFSLLSHLTDRETSLQIVLDPQLGGGITRRDQFGSPTRWYGFGLDADGAVSFLNTLRSTLTHPGVRNPVLRLRIPDEESHRKALDRTLRAALTDNKDAATCLKEAAREWETLDKQLPAGEVRKNYLISLGLQP